MILLTNLLGASESRAQKIVPRGKVSAVVLVTPLVTPCSWRSLSTLCFALLPWSLLSQVHSGLGYWLRSVSVKVHGVALLLQRSLAWGWCYKHLWPWSTPSEVPDSGASRPAEDVSQAYSLRGPRLTPGPAEVLLPLKQWVQADLKIRDLLL